MAQDDNLDTSIYSTSCSHGRWLASLEQEVSRVTIFLSVLI